MEQKKKAEREASATEKDERTKIHREKEHQGSRENANQGHAHMGPKSTTKTPIRTRQQGTTLIGNI